MVSDTDRAPAAIANADDMSDSDRVAIPPTPSIRSPELSPACSAAPPGWTEMTTTLPFLSLAMNPWGASPVDIEFNVAVVATNESTPTTVRRAMTGAASSESSSIWLVAHHAAVTDAVAIVTPSRILPIGRTDLVGGAGVGRCTAASSDG